MQQSQDKNSSSVNYTDAPEQVFFSHLKRQQLNIYLDDCFISRLRNLQSNACREILTNQAIQCEPRNTNGLYFVPRGHNECYAHSYYRTCLRAIAILMRSNATDELKSSRRAAKWHDSLSPSLPPPFSPFPRFLDERPAVQ